MPRAMELVSGFVTAPGAVLTALGMSPGDSLTVRAFDLSKKAWLLTHWANNATAGIMQVRSPRMHDVVNGFRHRVLAAVCEPAYGAEIKQSLSPGDALVAELSGGAGAEIDTGCLLFHYEDLPGAAGRFITEDDVKKRAVSLFCSENTLAFGAGGGWTGGQVITVAFNNWRPHTDYALIGYECSAICAAVAWRGTDTANLRVGGPGSVVLRDMTKEWFLKLSRDSGLPCVPVFNSDSRPSITIDGAQNNGAAASIVTSIFAELAP